MLSVARLTAWVLPLILTSACAGESLISDDAPLEMPPVGAHELRVLSPTLLELTLITTKNSQTAPVNAWDFVDPNRRAHLPGADEFMVFTGGKTNTVDAVGFKRRVLYAPLKKRDLRIGNYLYLRLKSPIADGQSVRVQNPNHQLWSADVHFDARADALRFSPAIHVNQVGYLPDKPKRAMVGYYLGSLGELDLNKPGTSEIESGSSNTNLSFEIVDTKTGNAVYQGPLVPRRDVGFPFVCYQNVFDADFTSFNTPGEYRLAVRGLGASFPFFIGDGVAGVFAETHPNPDVALSDGPNAWPLGMMKELLETLKEIDALVKQRGFIEHKLMKT